VINPIRDLPAEFFGRNRMMNTPNEFNFGGGMTNFNNMYPRAGNELDRIMTKKSTTFRANIKWM
jgi:hypothetical protein